jgi:bifunctional DNase/RNase
MWPLRQLAAALAAIAVSLACGDAPEPEAERDVPVRVGSVGVDRFNSPVVILEEQDGPRMLPIWIGAAEASSIAAHLHDRPPPRPNFHDLAKRVIQSVEAQLVRVVVTELRDGTYYATLELRTNGKIVAIDVRPSDAIAVAVRLDAPILVREGLFEQAGDALTPDDSGQSVRFEAPQRPHPPGSPPATPALEL